MVCRRFRAWYQQLQRKRDPTQFQRVSDPRESYSPWDTGWLYGVAWIAGLLLIGMILGYLTLALEVLKWWTETIRA